MNPIRVLETIGRVSPLGCRFYDAVQDRIVYEGLQVTAYLLSTPEKRRSAVVTRSGAFSFRQIPCLTALEFGMGDDDYWQSLPPAKKAAVEVIDLQGQFQPFWFEVDVPMKGLVVSICGETSSPPESSVGIPLYSAPTRSVKEGIAVLRAQLWDATEDVPASWAYIEVWNGTTLRRRGIADREGRLAIFFPYPDLDVLAPGSPPLDTQPLHGKVWSLEIRGHYQRWDPVPDIPNICEVLAQPTAQLWSGDSPLSPLSTVQLEYGRELVVKSTPRSELLISTAGSPP